MVLALGHGESALNVNAAEISWVSGTDLGAFYNNDDQADG